MARVVDEVKMAVRLSAAQSQAMVEKAGDWGRWCASREINSGHDATSPTSSACHVSGAIGPIGIVATAVNVAKAVSIRITERKTLLRVWCAQMIMSRAVKFSGPAWREINNWQLRWRW